MDDKDKIVGQKTEWVIGAIRLLLRGANSFLLTVIGTPLAGFLYSVHGLLTKAESNEESSSLHHD